jgi:hypothetical protein
MTEIGAVKGHTQTELTYEIESIGLRNLISE